TKVKWQEARDFNHGWTRIYRRTEQTERQIVRDRKCEKRRGPGASRHLQLGHLSNRRNVAPRQICVQIAQMLLEVLQGFALRHVIRIVFEVTKPELAILPVNIPKTFHGVKIHLRLSLGNNIVFAE